MTRVYKNNFVFIANCYEEWQGGRCISQGSIDTEIVAEVSGNNVHFELSEIQNLRIIKSFDFQILGADFCVLPDRIQYTNATSDFNPTVPMVCNLFYSGNDIQYVRFAMTNPDRLIEFYGNMTKLGQPTSGKCSNFKNCDVTASSVINELASYGMLNADALMERAVNLYNQVQDVSDISTATKVLESLKMFVKAYKLDKEETEEKGLDYSILKPKILEFLALSNFKIGNFNNSYCIAKQGLKAIDEVIENSVFVGLPREHLGERNMMDVINIIEQNYLNQVNDVDDIWNVDPTYINTEQYDHFLSSQSKGQHANNLSKTRIEDIVKTIHKVQSVFNDYGNTTGNTQMFMIADGLEMFLNPLYYAWEKLKYGWHTDFLNEGDSMFGYMIFEADVRKNVQNAINCLREASPFTAIEREGRITQTILGTLIEIQRNLNSWS